jgi:hypothetical protein
MRLPFSVPETLLLCRLSSPYVFDFASATTSCRFATGDAKSSGW